VLQFDQRGQSDGGALLLKRLTGVMDDRRAWLTVCETSGRRQSIILEGLLRSGDSRSRVAIRMPTMRPPGRRSIHKMLLDRDPGRGRDLASAADAVAFRKMPSDRRSFIVWRGVGGSVIQRHAQRLRVVCAASPSIWIHRRSHLRRSNCRSFNRHYDSWCYLPVMGYRQPSMTRPNSICVPRVAPRQRDGGCGRGGEFCAD